jgi:hypothetical protein
VRLFIYFFFKIIETDLLKRDLKMADPEQPTNDAEQVGFNFLTEFFFVQKFFFTVILGIRFWKEKEEEESKRRSFQRERTRSKEHSSINNSSY